jgi:hypothetical protein
MTPNDFLGQLSQLPPDTPITAQHLISILAILTENGTPSGGESKDSKYYYSLDREDLVNEVELAKWINRSVQTLKNWRVIGKGPKFTKDGGVNYRVGTVIDWIRNKEAQSTTQADFRKFGGMEFDTVFPTIYIDFEPKPFFESLDEESTITGYEVLWAEKGSLSSWFLSVMELGIETDTIISELEKRVQNGLDINSTQSFLKNNQPFSETLAHIIAKIKMDSFEENRLLINALFTMDIDFKQVNSDGLTAIEIAKQYHNDNLVKMIESKALFDKFNEILPRKESDGRRIVD